MTALRPGQSPPPVKMPTRTCAQARPRRSKGGDPLAWDANRPVPWRRVLREATIFIVAGTLAITVSGEASKARQLRRPRPRDGVLRGVHRRAVEVRLPAPIVSRRRVIAVRRPLPRSQPPSAPAARQRPAPTRAHQHGAIAATQPVDQEEDVADYRDTDGSRDSAVRHRHRRRHDRCSQQGDLRRRWRSGSGVSRVHPDLSATRLGRARRRGDLAGRRVDAQYRDRARRSGVGRRHRHRQPA